MTDISTQSANGRKTDLNTHGLLGRFVPAAAQPYAYLMRLDRPIGTWLLLLPGWWGIALAAASAAPDIIKAVWMGVLFGVGAVIMRGAGCVINDLWDRDFDAMVARTRTRPLAAGTVTPRQAILFTAVLLFIGLLILLQMNVAVFLLGVLSLPFIAIYPLMKRVTWWPQFFLGLTFNFGALMGWAAMTGQVSAPSLLLYAAGIFWTLGYDTIYAHMDREDDRQVGIKSTARLFGTHSKKMIAVFYAGTSLLLTAALAQIAGFFLAALFLIPAFAAFVWQVRTLDIDNGALCLRLFKFNRDQGFLILAAIILCAIAA